MAWIGIRNPVVSDALDELLPAILSRRAQRTI